MNDDAVLRLLELVARELAAEDAWIEIGGAPSNDPHVLWVEVGTHRRLLVRFAQPVDDPKPNLERLQALVEAFEDAATAPEPLSASVPPSLGRVALDAELAFLAARTQAPAALVVDATSPVVWGRSLPWLGDDAAALEAVGRELLVVEGDPDDDGDEAPIAAPASLSEEDRAVWLLCARAVAIGRRAMRQEDKAKRIIDTVHDRGGERPVVLRSLAALYLLILPFDAERPLSDLRTWPALRSAAPRLERIIASLPPVDPPPKRGRVVPLKR